MPKRRWWQQLDEHCPLSLESLSEKSYPPFNLGTDESHTTYFDGRTLAKWLISSGKFIHPCSRREITRDECKRLDRYLREHRLGDGLLFDVLYVFDHPQIYDLYPSVPERDPSEDESDGVQDDEEEEAEEDSWPTLGQALRDSIASNEVEPYDPYEAYDAYDSTEEYERWLTHLDNGGAVHPDDRE
jgi:hypothetical protein